MRVCLYAEVSTDHSGGQVLSDPGELALELGLDGVVDTAEDGRIPV